MEISTESQTADATRIADSRFFLRCLMRYLLGLALHIFGVHIEKKNGDEAWNAAIGKGEYRCIVCKRVFRREDNSRV